MARSSWAVFCAALACGWVAPAYAQTYPARAIRIIVPFPAGGTADLMPRIIAEKLSARWRAVVRSANVKID